MYRLHIIRGHLALKPTASARIRECSSLAVILPQRLKTVQGLGFKVLENSSCTPPEILFEDDRVSGARTKSADASQISRGGAFLGSS